MKFSRSLLLSLLSLAPISYAPALTPTISLVSQTKQHITGKTWFTFAQNDLRAAQILCAIDTPLLGVALYHIEQAAEKALKAYLVFTGLKFALVHDLPPLLSTCASNDEDFNQFAADMKEISPIRNSKADILIIVL